MSIDTSRPPSFKVIHAGCLICDSLSNKFEVYCDGVLVGEKETLAEARAIAEQADKKRKGEK